MSGAWPEIVWSADHDRAVISRAARRGTLRRLGVGLYTGAVDDDPDTVVRRHLFAILAHELPGAVIVDRAAHRGGLPADGHLYVTHQRSRPLILPGLVVVPRRNAVGPVEGDIALPGGIFLASPTRAMLEGLASTSAGRLTQLEIEEWLDRLCAFGGDPALNAIRDLANRIAASVGTKAAEGQLSRLIAAALATGDAADATSDALRARARGAAFDAVRAARFERLSTELLTLAPHLVPDLSDDASRRTLLLFFEAYFSNFIEGTEFTIDEAASIVLDGAMPTDRPADAHDVAGTYQVLADSIGRSRRARTGDEFVALLCERHAQVMKGRPDKRPGQFKHLANRAGATEFVAPDLVEGTLRHGFETSAGLIDPFQRAVFMMFVVAEVHPFLDGNGRVARLMMNAELSGALQVRLIVPTVLRLNYLAALKAATHSDVFAPLIAVLDFAQRFTARVDFSSMASAQADLIRTNALRDPYEAEQSGIRLQLP